MKKKKQVQFVISAECDEMIDDLALLLGISRSVLVERCVRYIYENELEGELFYVKRKRKKDKVDDSREDRGGKKEEVKREEFILKL